jgi:UDP-N-acetylglucosamine acyltransferase
MPDIHPTAVVDPNAEIADDVYIGPLCIVDGNVAIGEKTKLVGQCYITGHTTIGARNEIYPGACIGAPPQDVSWDDSIQSYVQIGDDNRIREHVTIHRGSKQGSETIIGNNNYLMNYVHIAHDCKVGSFIAMVPYSGASGHCELMDRCFISGLSGMHQFCRVGRFAMLSGSSAIAKDLPPFMIADGRHGAIRGINIVALRRNNFSAETIRVIKEIYQIFYRSDLNQTNALKKIKTELPRIDEVNEFIDFVEKSERGVIHGLSLGRRT